MKKWSDNNNQMIIIMNNHVVEDNIKISTESNRSIKTNCWVYFQNELVLVWFFIIYLLFL